MDKNILTVSLGNCGGKVVEDYCSVKKFQQIFAGLSYSSLVFLNPSIHVPSFIVLLCFTVCSFECQTSRRANKSNTA